MSRKRKRFKKEPEGGSTTRRGGGGSEERRGGSNSRRWPPERGERSSLDRAWGWKHHREAKSQQRKEIVFLPLSWCFDTTHITHTTPSPLSLKQPQDTPIRIKEALSYAFPSLLSLTPAPMVDLLSNVYHAGGFLLCDVATWELHHHDITTHNITTMSHT